MKTIASATLILLVAASLYAQPTLTGVKLVSEIGFTPLPLDQKTSETSPCASSSYTTDSKIFTVVVKVQPQISGATQMKAQSDNVWRDDATPSKFYFATGTPGITQIKTQRKTYESYVNAAAEIVVPDLTWADTADILTELQKDTAAATALKDVVASSASLSLIPVTLPDDTTLGRFLQTLADQGANAVTENGWTKAIQLLQGPAVIKGQSTGSAIALKLPAKDQITTDFNTAPQHLQGLVNAIGVSKASVQGTQADATVIFLVDSPCLTVELLPSTTGNNVTGGIVDFSGHYLFPFAKGHSYAKFGIGGTSPLNRSSGDSQTLTANADVAFNHDMNDSSLSGPIRFTGGLTAAYQHADVSGGDRTNKGSGGLKGSVSFSTFTQLTGNDTRPTLTFEAVGSTINGTASNTTQFEGDAQFKAKFRWTSVISSAIDATGAFSHDAIYGGRKNNYLINVDVVKFIVRDPIEFAATWKCGRPAPDYKRVCALFTGFSITSQQ